MARFHPNKRSFLSIASHQGAVTIYDINSKRKMCHYTDAHISPCRDLCISSGRPDTLISVGFDCRVNIFDVRRKLPAAKFDQSHPLSAVAISVCGNYICTGNLKGELMTYDLRKIHETQILTTRKVHEGQVARIAFFSTDELKDFTSNCSNNIENINTTNNDISTLKEGDFLEDSKILLNNESTDMIFRRRDSFNDFLDDHVQSFLPSVKVSIWDEKRNSLDNWDKLGQNNRSDSALNPQCKHLEEEHESGESLARVVTPDASASSERGRLNTLNASASSERGRLKQIQEEEQLSIKDLSADSDKENNHTDLEMSKRLPQLTADRNSTPKITNGQRSGEMSTTPTMTATGVGVNNDISLWRAEMNARFDQLESELKFQIETSKWQVYTQNFNMWNKLNENDEVMCQALERLLQSDPFVNEFWRLKKENELLKKELQKLTKK